MTQTHERSPVLDADAVRAWLEAMEPQAVCGVAGESADCPLARYLQAAYNTEDVRISPVAFEVDDECVKLPEWAANFVDRVDEDSFLAQVTAQKALGLLGRAVRWPAFEDGG